MKDFDLRGYLKNNRLLTESIEDLAAEKGLKESPELDPKRDAYILDPKRDADIINSIEWVKEKTDDYDPATGMDQIFGESPDGKTYAAMAYFDSEGNVNDADIFDIELYADEESSTEDLEKLDEFTKIKKTIINMLSEESVGKFVVRPCSAKDTPWAVWKTSKGGENDKRIKGFKTKEDAQKFANEKNSLD